MNNKYPYKFGGIRGSLEELYETLGGTEKVASQLPKPRSGQCVTLSNFQEPPSSMISLEKLGVGGCSRQEKQIN